MADEITETPAPPALPGGPGALDAAGRRQLYIQYARKQAEAKNLNPDFVEPLLQAESSFDPGAISPAGAKGIGQLTPSAIKVVRPEYAKNPNDFPYHDPFQNIDASIDYMLWLRDQPGIGDNLGRIAASYNTSVENVQRAIKGRDINALPSETRAYVPRVDKLGGGIITRKASSYITAPQSTEGVGAPNAVSALPPGFQQDNPLYGPPALPSMKAVDIPEYQPLTTGQKIGQTLGAVGLGAPSQIDPYLMGNMALQMGSVFLPVGRMASAAIQGGASAYDAIEREIQKQQEAGQPVDWVEAAKNLDRYDALVIGGSILAGALFPGKPTDVALSEALTGIRRPPRPAIRVSKQERDIAKQAGKLATATSSSWRAATDYAKKFLNNFPTDNATVKAAYDKINPAQEVDVTDVLKTIHSMSREGVTIPKKVQAWIDNAIYPLKQAVPESPILGDFNIVSRIEPVEVGMQEAYRGTGRYMATAGDTIKMMRNLGSTVNEARKTAVEAGTSMSLQDLRALRNGIYDSFRAALPAADQPLLDAARETAKEIGQNRRVQREIANFVNPNNGFLDTSGLINKFSRKDPDLVRTYGIQNVRAMQRWAKAIEKLEAQPSTNHMLTQALRFAHATGLGAAATGALVGAGATYGEYGTTEGLAPSYLQAAALGFATGLSTQVIFRMATRPAMLHLTESLAASHPGTLQFARAAGRFALASRGIIADITKEMQDQLGEQGVPPTTPRPEAPPPSALGLSPPPAPPMPAFNSPIPAPTPQPPSIP